MTPDPGEPPSMAAALTDALMQIAEMATQVAEATEAYRADCQRRGFSETASEVVAMEYHAFLFAQIRGAMP